MIPELGNFLLIFSMINSLLLISIAFIYPPKDKRFFLSASLVTFLAIFLSFIALEISFLTDDFSVLYVATNSNPNLPIYYKFAALWGGHEGSLLLFLLILAGWILVFVFFNEVYNFINHKIRLIVAKVIIITNYII